MKTFSGEVKEKTHLLCAHPALKALKETRVTREQFLMFTIQRHAIAEGFVDLLVRARDLCVDPRLKKYLAQNWSDETGSDEPSANHAVWRKDYLQALEISGQPTKPLRGTRDYNQALAGLTCKNQVFAMAGAILFLEHSIPPEFTCLQKARDHLFPHLTPRAKLYLDDHIRHDAKYHYPDLLHALVPHEANKAIAEEVYNGIKRIFQAKLCFYDSIREELGL